jgi:pimeloyl-ACP methyl ester carboxylesterase
MMTAADVVPGYQALVPQGFRHEGMVAGQIGTRIGLYYPGRAVKDLKMPVLFALCDKDSVAPVKRSARYAAQAVRGEIKHYPVGHFDIYLGQPFETAVADQVDFLRRHLAPASPVPAA